MSKYSDQLASGEISQKFKVFQSHLLDSVDNPHRDNSYCKKHKLCVDKNTSGAQNLKKVKLSHSDGSFVKATINDDSINCESDNCNSASFHDFDDEIIIDCNTRESLGHEFNVHSRSREWLIEEVSSGCESSPQRPNSGEKLQPETLHKFASPIVLPSLLCDLAPVKVVPLLRARTKLDSKHFKKQTIASSSPSRLPKKTCSDDEASIIQNDDISNIFGKSNEIQKVRKITFDSTDDTTQIKNNFASKNANLMINDDSPNRYDEDEWSDNLNTIIIHDEDTSSVGVPSNLTPPSQCDDKSFGINDETPVRRSICNRITIRDDVTPVKSDKERMAILEDVTPIKDRSVIHELVTPSNDHFSPIFEDITPKKHCYSVIHEDITPKKDHSVIREDVTLGKDNFSPIFEDLTPKKHCYSVIHEDITPKKDHSVIREDVTRGKDNFSPIFEDVTPRKDFSALHDITPIKHDRQTNPELFDVYPTLKTVIRKRINYKNDIDIEIDDAEECDDITPVCQNGDNIQDDDTPVKDNPTLIRASLKSRLISEDAPFVKRLSLGKCNKIRYNSSLEEDDEFTSVKESLNRIKDMNTPDKKSQKCQRYCLNPLSPSKDSSCIRKLTNLNNSKEFPVGSKEITDKSVADDLSGDIFSSSSQDENRADIKHNHSDITPVQIYDTTIHGEESPVKIINSSDFTESGHEIQLDKDNSPFSTFPLSVNDETSEEDSPRLHDDYQRRSLTPAKIKLECVVTSAKRNYSGNKVKNKNSVLSTLKAKRLNVLFNDDEEVMLNDENIVNEEVKSSSVGFNFSNCELNESNRLDVAGYDIDSFPSPSKDASIMPYEHDNAVIAEIPGLTPKKIGDPGDSGGVVFILKKKKRLFKPGTLLSKAVNAVNNLKSDCKLFSYELEVGLKNANEFSTSENLIVLKFQKDHSSFFMQCKKHTEDPSAVIGSQFIDNSITFVMNEKPKDISINDTIKVYYPITVIYLKNPRKHLICIARHIQIMKRNDLILGNNLDDTNTPSPTLSIGKNYPLAGIFKRSFTTDYAYFKIRNLNTTNIVDSFVNSRLISNVTVQVKILHSVVSDRRIYLAAVDCQGEYCCIEFVNCEAVNEFKNFSDKKYLVGSECLFNNVNVIKQVQSWCDIRFKTLIEFCHSKSIDGDFLIYIVFPNQPWSFKNNFKLISVNLESRNKPEDKQIDYSTSKRYRIALNIISSSQNRLTSTIINSNVELDVLIDDNMFVDLFKTGNNIFADGILCYKKQLVIDKFTNIFVL